MPRKALTHRFVTEDRDLEIEFSGPVPRLGEVVEVDGAGYLVKAVRWVAGDRKDKGAKRGAAQSRDLSATVVCRTMKDYTAEYENEGEGHLRAGWWETFPRPRR